MLKPNIDREALTQTLKDLVKIDSVNPSLVKGAAGEKEIANYLEDWMTSLGLKTKRYDVEPSRPNVVGVLKGTGGGKTLLLNGHTDTVGVDYMTIDPFDPVIKDNKLYGRGSFDMKGGLAASMAAVKTIVEENTILKGNIILATVCDEEYASIGTEHLMKNTTANAAIVGEFTGGNIQVAHKGFAWLDIETYGVAAHGSLYRIGVDAIAKMGHILIGLEEIGQNLEKTEHPLVGPGSIHASIIEGGSELSTYPASCKLQIERRLIPGEDRDDVDEEISNLIKSLEACDPKFNADYRITFYRGPMEISPKEEICRVLEEGSERLLEKTPRYIGGTAWMDTQIIHSKGIPAIAYGPLGYGAHAEEEWVDLKSVYETALVHWYAIKEFCKAS
jgi:acetylornithine deacetylase